MTMIRSFHMIIIFLGVCQLITSAPNINVKFALCNSRVISKNGPFQKSLTYVLDDLQSMTPSKETYDLRNISPYPTSFAYGRAVCTADNLTTSDCNACLGAAKSVLLSTCGGRAGGRAVLGDCQMRYEQYPYDD
ncbi:hypothetical protein Leryth_013800 [Lithospermum erythrorhizon]|uniref:Gnk2-homologous domain-containing protein n=1 Tax=Lithospermum erythrorhizon TaxID=34254 RepID=A0AAV3NYH2_LITER|nr:hypothetical protein Leryth_013800 [Lithospermum erythrorhizon]